MDSLIRKISAIITEMKSSLEEMTKLSEGFNKFLREEDLEEKYRAFLEKEEANQKHFSTGSVDYLSKEEQERLNKIIEDYQKHSEESEFFISEERNSYTVNSSTLLERMIEEAKVQTSKQKSIAREIEIYESIYHVCMDESAINFLKEYVAYEPDFNKVRRIAEDIAINESNQRESIEFEVRREIESSINQNKRNFFDSFNNAIVKKQHSIMR